MLAAASCDETCGASRACKECSGGGEQAERSHEVHVIINSCYSGKRERSGDVLLVAALMVTLENDKLAEMYNSDFFCVVRCMAYILL